MPMPAVLNASERIALAPINVNVSSPLQARKSASFRNCLLPLTPTIPRPFLPKSASVLVKSDNVKNSALSGYKITNNRNVKADLAATKLKLRLQLAFYKLKQQKAAFVFTPQIKTMNFQVSSALTPSLLSVGASSTSATRITPETRRFPLLNTVANKKTGTMHLLHIKSLSSYHNSFPSHLPLRGKVFKLPSVHKILKTPIKAAARRQMVMGNSNSDETIDETVGEIAAGMARKNEDILSSSPIGPGSFGTPNSFLVAKSLLLLGLARF
ncbi:hypothetical protein METBISCDRAFT_21224 [Metschnikowia bicuspidata]|uniref:Uncharacterized protein n=1 Tax=Metschnikowia bicuspidata TaxID=27322 RepID=A0A4P9ZIU3_9ASCO|nr:hypothetical protein METBISCDRAFT_21224 [Metschnikowia bicuspidata]